MRAVDSMFTARNRFIDIEIVYPLYIKGTGYEELSPPLEKMEGYLCFDSKTYNPEITTY